MGSSNKKWRLAIGLVASMLVSMNARSDSPLTNMAFNISAATSAAKKQQTQKELEGVWVNIKGERMPVFKFSSQGSIFSKGRIGSFEVRTAYSQLTSRELSEKLAHLLAEPDDPAYTAEHQRHANALKRNRGLRRHIVNLQTIAAQAAAAGEQTLTRVHIDLRFPRTMNYNKYNDRIAFYYTKSRIYLLEGYNISIYIREDALSTQETNQFHKNNFEGQLDNAYIGLRQVCYQLLLSEKPVEACRATRDLALHLGVKARPEDVHPRDVNLEMPNADQLAFLKSFSDGKGQDQFLPRLGYCFKPTGDVEEARAFYAQLAKRGYRNTLWLFRIFMNIPPKKAGNWTEKEYAAIRSVAIGGGEPYFFLRADGIVGLSRSGAKIEYDARNRWTLSDGALRISFHNDVVWFQFPIANNYPNAGTSNLPLAESVALEPIRGDYEAFNTYSHPPSNHPDQATLKALIQAQSCADGNVVPFIAAQESAPAYVEPPAPVSIESLPKGFPRYWLVRVVLANGQKDPDAKRQAQMDKGIFYHLGDSNRLGSSYTLAGPYDYPESMSWNLEGSNLVWDIVRTSTERYTFKVNPSTDFTANSVGRINKKLRLLISPASGASPAVTIVDSEQVTKLAPLPDIEPAPVPESVRPTPINQPEQTVVSPPTWEIVGFWTYDAIDGQQLVNGLVLREKPGALGTSTWRHQLELTSHSKLIPRARHLFPVNLSRQDKKVCVNAPYPSYPGYIDLPGTTYDGIYTFASCKGGG